MIIGEATLDGLVAWDSVDSSAPGIYRLVANVTDTCCLGPGDNANVDPSHHVPQFEGGCDVPLQKGAHLTGVVCNKAFVCRSCRCNAHNALCNRHCRLRPKVSERFTNFSRSKAWFAKHTNILQPLYEEELIRWREQWIFKWSAKKQAAIVRSLTKDPVSPAWVELMVKREVLSSYKPKARGIQKYPNLATQAESAPYFYAAQKSVARAFGVDSPYVDGVQFVFASGLNYSEVGRWMNGVLARGLTFFYERDGANWDATMGLEHHTIKTHVYGLMDEELVRAADASRDVRGVHYPKDRDLPKMRYSVQATTKSGHNDTSLGNSLVNFAIALEAVQVLREQHPGLEASCLVMGDDLLVALSERVDSFAFAQIESECGIKPEARAFDNPEDVSFISGIFVPTASGYVFSPRPGSLLAKLFWSIREVPKKHYDAYLNGIVDGLAPLYRGWPVIEAWLLSHRRAGASEVRDARWKAWFQGLASCGYDEVTADWFGRRYGLGAVEVSEVETILKAHGGAPALLKHSATDRIMERDLAGLDDRELSV